MFVYEACAVSSDGVGRRGRKSSVSRHVSPAPKVGPIPGANKQDMFQLWGIPHLSSKILTTGWAKIHKILAGRLTSLVRARTWYSCSSSVYYSRSSRATRNTNQHKQILAATLDVSSSRKRQQRSDATSWMGERIRNTSFQKFKRTAFAALARRGAYFARGINYHSEPGVQSRHIRSERRHSSAAALPKPSKMIILLISL